MIYKKKDVQYLFSSLSILLHDIQLTDGYYFFIFRRKYTIYIIEMENIT